MKDKKKSKAGFARAKALTPSERSRIAKQAAAARWDGDLPIAEYEGDFKVGDTKISSVVLPNGLRVISQSTFQRAVGRARTVKAGRGLKSGVELPYFLQTEALKPFITEELAMASNPVFYRTKTGGKGVGYDARLLPKVADVYLQFRDDAIKNRGTVPKRYENMVIAADILVRGLADVGIVALVDEATGYQRDRAKDALSKILEEFIAKELRPWVHTFPDEFYAELFRLRGLSFPTDTVKKPQYFGLLTNNIIYARLAPSVLEELKKATPRDSKGRHKQQLHRRLTEDVGHPKLREHLMAVIALMKVSPDYKSFTSYLDKVYPKYGDQLSLPINQAGL